MEGIMKKFKKHIMVSAILLILFFSSVSVFAQKNQEEKTKAVFGDETFVSNLAFEKIFDKVVEYLKIQGETIETADKNIGQIITALDVSGSVWFTQTNKKIQITLIKQNEQNTLIRVWVTENHVGLVAWQFEVKINKEKSKNLAQSIKKFLESDIDTTQKQVESEKAVKAETADTLTNTDVIQMTKQKLPDQIIIQKIKYSKCKFDTSPDALSILNKSGVSEQIILVMMENTAASEGNPTSASVLTQKKQKEKKTKFGIGFQYSSPALGISGILDVTPNVSIQGILDPLGDLKTYVGRGIYRFKKKSNWNAYGYGMLGTWSYPIYGGGLLYWDIKEGTEKIMVFGAGVGIEQDCRSLGASFSGFPPLWLNFEIGLRSAKFKEASYNPLLPISVGVGIHYRF